ncbi:hypothetical protein [Tenggerimyces flavus]|uniref:hypothetical protein n=1 Tax=Tenggerimyces flavus TaxID=1708749 RepID=UPI0019614086|nr:hypothetical protein [Tenggerimyces flavus]MBM7790146.1 hypothetical protein [Tenggerimyces flavus]
MISASLGVTRSNGPGRNSNADLLAIPIIAVQCADVDPTKGIALAGEAAELAGARSLSLRGLAWLHVAEGRLARQAQEPCPQVTVS